MAGERQPSETRSLITSVNNGKVDLLIAITKLMAHKEFGPLNAAAKATGTPIAMATSGYGVEAIRVAIEGVLLREPARA